MEKEEIKKTLEEKIGEEKGQEIYKKLEEYLKADSIYEDINTVEDLYKLKPEDRMADLYLFAEKEKIVDLFPKIYGTFEEVKDKVQYENAIKSAISAIISEDGKVPANINVEEVIKSIEEEDEKKKELKRAAIKAAISAILSRNTSHNIGSHVISELSNYGNIRGVNSDFESYDDYEA